MYLHKIQKLTDTEQTRGVSPLVSSKADFPTVTEARVKSREYCAR